MSPNNSGGVWFAVAVAVFLATVAYAAVVILPGSDLAYSGNGLPPCC